MLRLTRCKIVHALAKRPLQRIDFFFNDTATTDIYTLSLHDALPISPAIEIWAACSAPRALIRSTTQGGDQERISSRSEEHTSELQSRQYLVCRLLLDKKKVVGGRDHGREEYL